MYPAFRIAAYVMYSITLNIYFGSAFTILSGIVIITIVFVSPYKQPYKRYNKLDVAMLFCLGAIPTGMFFTTTPTDKKNVLIYVGYTLSVLLSLTPLVYFTIKFCLFIKHVLVQKLSTWYSDSGRGDYRNLISVN